MSPGMAARGRSGCDPGLAFPEEVQLFSTLAQCNPPRELLKMLMSWSPPQRFGLSRLELGWVLAF